jgi:hypothetical protein
MHVIGASGTGKSTFLESLIRQDVISGHGICLIDPHGRLADAVVRFCASRCVKPERVHIIDPSEESWSAGFNPLHRDGRTDPTVRVDMMVDTLAEIWGGERLDDAPLLSTCLQLLFYALAAHRLTLTEAVALTQATDAEGLRRRLTECLPDEVYASYWDDFRSLSRRDFEERFSSTRRRLLRLLGKPAVRRMMGQRDHVIDLRRIMDQGEILIVNLAAKGPITPATGRLIGSLLLSEFYLAAIGRSEEKARRRPFYLYVDECYDFLTGDVEKMLDQARKFGLHLILAHHRLAQLQRRSEDIYSAVMTGAQTKVVFGGLTDDDADVMVREIMRDAFDLERPKHTFDRPTVVGTERIWLASEGSSRSTSSSKGWSEGSSWSDGTNDMDSAALTYAGSGAWNSAQQPIGRSEISGTGRSSSSGGSFSVTSTRAKGSSHSVGRHEATAPIYQVLPTQAYSLEEEMHRAIVHLRELPNQRAIVKVRGQKAKGVLVPEIRTALVGPKDIGSFEDASRQLSPYLSKADVADAEIKARREELGLLAAPEAANFWTEEDAA